MKDSIGDKQRLEHIADAIAEIEVYVNGVDINVFNENSMMRFATIKQLEIIGEAANHITTDTKEKFTEVNWAQIVGMRHILVHEYFGIDNDVIWLVIITYLPELKVSILNIIETL